ncbi:MAG: aldo/keto reductase [Acidimicrobiia bacterium]|nr:aldo/keto reductase [Acidimicrobiia bacterium]
METRRIGQLEVSVVGLGGNNFGMALDAAGTRQVLDAAIDAGVTYVDTADLYGGGASEEHLGAALQGRRDAVVLATKFGHSGSTPPERPGGSPAWVREATEASLRRLGTDHVDHLMIHQPDPSTPIEETLGALDELVREGKAREIGCSNFSADQLREADAAARREGTARFASVQNHYSLLTRAAETEGVLDACAELDVGFVPFFPLESGLLTGKYRKGQDLPEGSRLANWGPRASRFINDERLEVVERLRAYAEGKGHHLLELSLGWLVSNPTVSSVIAGATKTGQVHDNAAAAMTWPLSPAERAEVDALLAG